jgi:hypothetical protein
MPTSGSWEKASMTVSDVSPKKSRGFTRRPVTSTAGGRTKTAVCSRMLAAAFIATTAARAQAHARAQAGKEIARLLPNQMARGLKGVARRVSRFPEAFSLIISVAPNAQTTVIKGSMVAK